MLRVQDHTEGDGSGRRCYAVVMFADLCDYTPLVELMDPEEVSDLTSQLLELATGVINKHGGIVNQVYGDGVLAIFGYPLPQEDDARRAVEAALELHSAMHRASWHIAAGQPRLHSGIDSGLIFVRRGSALRGQYDVTGDAFNTSARLCAAAARDEILVSESVLSGIEAFFSYEAQGSLELKGKRLPLRVHRVTGHSGVRTRLEARERSGMTTFVGRDRELERLSQLLAEARAGTPRIALVSGAPGIGKSRLLAQLIALAAATDNTQVLRGSCESYGDVAPLQPVVQVLRHVFGLQQSTLTADDSTQIVTERVRALGAMVSEHLETYLQLLSLRPLPADATEQQSMTLALAQLVGVIATQATAVLVLDDWQWADDTSRKVLEAIYRSSEGRRLCVIVGMRAGERIDPILESAETLPLEPFSKAESVHMIHELRPSVLDLGITEAIHRRSGGNPLFLEELCRSLPDDALAIERPLVPTTLHGMVQARLNQVSAAQAALLQAASVIGNDFSEELLVQVLDRADAREVLAEITRGDLVYATEVEGVFRFKHGITREVVYDSVRNAERRRLHRVIAEAIERAAIPGCLSEQYEALAYHYRGSGEHERAATYAELAGDKAMLTASLDRARLQYLTALTELVKLPMSPEQKRRWLVIGNKWAGVYVYSPSRQQMEMLQQAAGYAAELGDLGAQAHIAHWRGWTHYVLGEIPEAITHTRQGLEFAQAHCDPRILAQLWSTLGQCYVVAHEYTDALECLDRGIELKRARVKGRKGSVVAQGFAYGLSCRAILYAWRGEFDLAELDILEAINLVRGSGHPIEGSVLGNDCIVKLHRGEWAACIASSQRCCAIGHQVNAAYLFAIGKVLGTYASWKSSGEATFLRELRQAVDWLQELDTALWSSLSYGFLADAYATAGQFDEARHFAERALARAKLRDPLGEAMAYRVLARLAKRASTEVHEFLHRAFASAEAHRSRREAALNQLLVAELRLTSSADAIRAGTMALAEFESMGMRWHAEEARRAVSLARDSQLSRDATG
jgi:class 3 adenylate cyclase/tetratricopeptide (TPR) repeat protein